MTREYKKAGPRLTATGRQQEVGVAQLDKSTVNMLNVKADADVLSPGEWALVEHIKATCNLRDFKPFNVQYGPVSGISTGQRLIRAYDLGLLPAK